MAHPNSLAMEALDDKIRSLPPELQREVQDFVDAILERSGERPSRKLRLDWAGALKDGPESSGVELQRKAREWWGG